MRATAQRLGIWALVLALYWLAAVTLWPLLFGGESESEEPAFYLDEEFGIACYLWRDQIACVYIPDFEASAEFGDDIRLARL